MLRKSLEDDREPQLYREIFPFSDIPRVVWDFQPVKIHVPNEIYLTDTTFRDGQQARDPLTVEQIVTLYEKLHRLGGEKGIIRASEFFVYSKKDRMAVEQCIALEYDYPRVTGWVRASKEDLQLVKEMKISETGILTSISDYHILYKFNSTRSSVLEKHLSICEEALKSGVSIRCHLEDLTRADFHGSVVPFAQKLMKLEEKYHLPVILRLCDTLGLGVPFSEAALPRSIPKLVHGLRSIGVPSDRLEFHAHNDFHKGVVNATVAWLYGCTYVNTTLLSVGERAGNVPLEAMVIEYVQLRGSNDGMNLSVLTEIADYYEKTGFNIPSYYPILGKNFAVTRAGIHADGLLKDPQVYLPFDTEKILGIPPSITISPSSGLAGIAYWINSRFRLKGEDRISKHDPRVAEIQKWVSNKYAENEATRISDIEMEDQIRRYFPELFRH